MTKLPVKRETMEPSAFLRKLSPLFDDFGMGFRWSWRSLFAAEPLFRRELTWPKMPAVDVVESEKGYEITADVLAHYQLIRPRPGCTRHERA